MVTKGALVGFVGKKGSGKSTLAHAVRKATNNRWVVWGFAYPIKQMVVDVLGLDSNVVFWGNDEQKENEVLLLPDGTETSYRQILKDWGMFGRKYKEDIWVTLAMGKVRFFRERGLNVILDDVRFPNEVEMIQAEGGKTLRIERPGLVSNDSHPSETALDKFVADGVVYNAGTVAEGVDNVHRYFGYWGLPW